jgi:hypothetical protein
MKLKHMLFTWIFFISAFSFIQIEAAHTKKIAVSCQHKGRLGNQIVTYVHAKWLNYKYNLPHLFVPFDFCDQFALYDIEKTLLSDHYSEYKNVIVVNKNTNIKKLPDSTLIMVPFFHDEPNSCLHKNEKRYPINWNDPKFRTLVKSLLKPRFPVKTIPTKKNRFNLLVHVRKGGGFDSEATKLKFRYKFPPDNFYISGIRTASELLKQKPIFVYIMTDDQNPAKIIEEFKHALQDVPNLEFAYREGVSGPDENVLEDFFSVAKFDGCIRGDSTFTLMAAYLGDMKLVIAPELCHVENNEVIVDKVDIQFKK